MDWVKKIPVSIENGSLKLSPKNSEKPKKTVIEVTPKFKKSAEYAIANNFPGVLS